MLQTLTKDQTILDARKAGLDAMKNITALVHSVVVEIDGQQLTVFANGDVDAPDGFRYSIAYVGANGLVRIGG